MHHPLKPLAIAACAFIAFAGVSAQAGMLTGAEFLKWERTNQEFFIETSVGMTGLLVARNDKQQANCLEGWYLKDQSAKNDTILGAMEKNPTFHPRGVILAMLEKQCGSFVYKN